MTHPSLNESARLRFAPSPTGMLHIGGARTALFNWLLARNCGGKFVLRFEDTDRERSTAASVQAILDGLTWLGIDWDEGPFFQSKRMEEYAQALDQLRKTDAVYPCFCSQERLEKLRERARAEGRAFVYDGLCRNLSADEVKARQEAGEEHTWRFKVEPGSVTIFNDMIGGERRFENERFGDFIIQRSDGMPVFHFTVVVDDHTMGITHVVRGDDHLSNTPRQILIFKALGWPIPAYAHLPLIQGPDGSRLSKRHGATSVMEFADQGYLPEALFNYLALLGWSLDAETEIIPKDDLIRHFSMDRFNQSAARFDPQKLEWMNGVYMRQKPIEEIVEAMRLRFRDAGVDEDLLAEPRFSSIVALEVERSRTFLQMEENLRYFFEDRLSGYEPKAAQKHLLKEGAEDLLAKIKDALSDLDSFDAEALENILRGLAEAEGISFGKIVHPLRVALTGREHSPGIFDVLVGLGRGKTLERIDQAIEWIRAERAAPSTSAPASRDTQS